MNTSLTARTHFGRINGCARERLIQAFKTLLMVVSFLIVGLSFAHAETILHVHDNSGNLGRVNVLTGAVSIIGRMRTAGGQAVVMTDIAFDPNGNLFGISRNEIYRIDPTTAGVSLVGQHGISQGNALVFGSDGTLYAAGASTTSLFTINVNNGVGSSIGDMGFRSAGDLAFIGGGLFMSATTDQLISINLADETVGAAVGPFGFRNVFGLATGGDGVLYGVSGTSVFSVNVATGLGAFVSDFGGQGLGAANGSSFITEATVTPSGVPEPATMMLLGTGLLGVAAGARRRRRACDDERG